MIFDAIVLDAIRETFLAEGFTSDVVQEYVVQCGEVKYSKTPDGSVLGQMKEFELMEKQK